MTTEQGFPHSFVGVRHRELLGELVGAWEGLSRPRLIVLSGFPGYGKSRLVQELYRVVAAGQAEPAYWPAEIPVGGDEVTARRKRLAPRQFTVPAGAEPSFVWLALEGRIDRDRETAEFALGSTEFAHQLADHVEAIIAHAEAGTARRSVAARDVADALSSLVGFVPFLGPLANALSVKDSFGALSQAVRSVRSMFGDRDPTERTVGTQDIAGQRRAAAAGLATISEIMPIVLVIEDAHDLDEVTVGLLHDLLEAGRGSVLIVATAWTDRLSAQAIEGSAWSFGGLAQHTRWAAIDRYDVPLLDDDAIRSLVLAHAPGTARALVDRLVARSGGNPLLIEGIVRLRAIARSYDPELRAFTVSADDAAVIDLPDTIEALYAQLWDELPAVVRDALMVASIEGAIFTSDWVTTTIHDVLGVVDAGDVIGRARDTYSWIRTLDERIDTFVEAALLDRAGDATRSELTGTERQRIRTALVERALDERTTEQWRQRPTDSRTALLRHVITATDEGLIDTDQAFSCRVELARHAADQYRYNEAVNLLQPHLDPHRTTPTN